MKLSEKSLENAALYYLQRYAATRAGLRTVLVRKIRRCEGSDEKKTATLAYVEPLLDRYVAAGLVNDAVFAEMRAGTLRRRGGSTRAIAQKLAQKGVDRATIATILDRDDDHEAARELCRRKRLGRDPERRQRDLGVLARAGFPYHVIVAVLGGAAT